MNSSTFRASAARAIGDTLQRCYPHGGGEGYALQVHEVDGVSFVYVLAAADHWVYVTLGCFHAPTPHEFVMRVFGNATGNSWSNAPFWPVRVLSEIAAAECRLRRPFSDGDDVTNLRHAENPQPPYRHFSFMSPDRFIPDALGPGGPIRFVRVIPLTDAQKDAIYRTGALGPLAEWHDYDPLMRVR